MIKFWAKIHRLFWLFMHPSWQMSNGYDEHGKLVSIGVCKRHPENGYPYYWTKDFWDSEEIISNNFDF